MARFQQQDEDRWISVSDIMTGLMVIFLFIAVAYIRVSQKTIARLEVMSTNLQAKQDTISRILANYRDTKKELFVELQNNLGPHLTKWGAEIDSTTLTIRFNGEETQFRSSKDNLPSSFKVILSDFFPRFLAVISDQRYLQEIVEVKVEGHAYESERKGEDYEVILRGSQNRARNVLLYCKKLSAYRKLPQAVRDQLEFKITTTGMGYGRMIDTNGMFVVKSGSSPCKKCSRRVEFTILTASEQVLEQIDEVK
ncbi:MAG: hypothetical protein GYB31_05620 [Bacteroidetes bacterium]|nr:hypothetical protein [Bacteroidota bacterium]